MLHDQGVSEGVLLGVLLHGGAEGVFQIAVQRPMLPTQGVILPACGVAERNLLPDQGVLLSHRGVAEGVLHVGVQGALQQPAQCVLLPDRGVAEVGFQVSGEGALLKASFCLVCECVLLLDFRLSFFNLLRTILCFYECLLYLDADTESCFFHQVVQI